MNMYNYSAVWAWKGRQETPTQIAEKYLRTLNELSKNGPILKDWGVGVTLEDDPRGGVIPLSEALKDMEKLVRENIAYDDWEQPDSASGYDMFASSNASTPDYTSDRTLSFLFQIGSKWSNEIRFNVGTMTGPSALDVATFSLFRIVMSTLTSIWSPEWAGAYAFKIDYDEPGAVAGVPVFPSSRFHIPWITYLSTPLAEGVTPPPGIQSEQTSDGGLLMVATQDQLDPANPEHMRLAKALADLMIAATGEMG